MSYSRVTLLTKPNVISTSLSETVVTQSIRTKFTRRSPFDDDDGVDDIFSSKPPRSNTFAPRTDFAPRDGFSFRENDKNNRPFTPRDNNRAFTPRDNDRSFTPRDNDRSFTPRDNDRSFTPRDNDRSFTPRDNDRSFTPRDNDRSFTPRDNNRPPRDNDRSFSSRDNNRTFTPRDNNNFGNNYNNNRSFGSRDQDNYRGGFNRDNNNRDNNNRDNYSRDNYNRDNYNRDNNRPRFGDRNDNFNRYERNDRFDRNNRNERNDRFDRNDRNVRNDRNDRQFDRSNRDDRPDPANRPDRPRFDRVLDGESDVVGHPAPKRKNDRISKTSASYVEPLYTKTNDFILNNRCFRGEAVWGTHAVLSAITNRKRRKYHTLYIASNLYEQAMTILTLERPDIYGPDAGTNLGTIAKNIFSDKLTGKDVESITGAPTFAETETETDTKVDIDQVDEEVEKKDEMDKFDELDELSELDNDIDEVDDDDDFELDPSLHSDFDEDVTSFKFDDDDLSNDDWVDADDGLDGVSTDITKLRDEDEEYLKRLLDETPTNDTGKSSSYMASSSATGSRTLGDVLAIIRAANEIPATSLRSPAKNLKIVSTFRKSMDDITNNSVHNGIILDCTPLSIRKQFVLRAHNFGIGSLHSLEIQAAEAEAEANVKNIEDEILEGDVNIEAKIEYAKSITDKLLDDLQSPESATAVTSLNVTPASELDPRNIKTNAGRKARNMSHLIEQGVGITRPGVIVALDTIQDPQNLGSLLRSSTFFGVQNVVLGDTGVDSTSPITGVVAKAASGALDLARLNSTSDLVELIRRTRILGDMYYSYTADDVKQNIRDNSEIEISDEQLESVDTHENLDIMIEKLRKAEEEAIMTATGTELGELSNNFEQWVGLDHKPVRNWGAVCIIALTAHSNVSVDATYLGDLGNPLQSEKPFGIVLVVGSEGAGIHPDILKAAHIHLNIAPAPAASSILPGMSRTLVDSINVTSATSIALNSILGRYNANALIEDKFSKL